MMKPIPHKTLFTFTLFSSTLMIISSSNPIIMWSSLELNLLSMIPLIPASYPKKESETMTKYFLAQALGSSIILTTLMLMTHSQYFLFPPLLPQNLATLGALIKLGAAPTHFWFPPVMESSPWMACILLSTWQKIAPLFFLSLMSPLTPPTLMLIVSSGALIGGILGLNQSSMNNIIAYSSIGHLSWLMPLAMMSLNSMMSYFMIYSATVILIMSLLKMSNINLISQMSSPNQPTSQNTTLLLFLLLSLGGLPPLLGFAPKLLALKTISDFNLLLALPLILGTSMNLTYYLTIFMNWYITTPPPVNKLTTKSPASLIPLLTMTLPLPLLLL